MAQPNSQVPFDFDVRDPNFRRDMLLWAFQTQCEINWLVAATKKTIAATKAMVAEAERIIAWK